MNILFLHQNFPAQFRHLATVLARQQGNQVVFLTAAERGEIPGVKKLLFKPSREVNPATHHYLKGMERSVLEGQAAYRTGIALKQQGFRPDLVYGHSGWGSPMFMKDLFPKSPLMCYFEWFYHAHGADSDFDPAVEVTADEECRLRISNAAILNDLYSCDFGLSPTQWQKSQFPREYAQKIAVLHDGVDTDYFRPLVQNKLSLPTLDLDLQEHREIVTYVARGMEPYRGFPQFMETLAILQKRRPGLQAIIVGADRVAYGKPLPGGKSYKELMLERLPLDLSRIHFTGLLPYSEYLKVLQASSVHVYLTRPFVLSWSMLEAMSAGCLIVGSATQPVQEVIKDGENGLLTDFFSPAAIAGRVEEALDNRQQMARIRDAARETIVERYDLKKLLPRHIELMRRVAGK
jgi:glycosyltransferase involved in cell wall biosynthesis